MFNFLENKSCHDSIVKRPVCVIIGEKISQTQHYSCSQSVADTLESTESVKLTESQLQRLDIHMSWHGAALLQLGEEEDGDCGDHQ